MMILNVLCPWSLQRFRLDSSSDGSTTEFICFVFVLWEFVEALRNITVPNNEGARGYS
jgi:hypothetical protein